MNHIINPNALAKSPLPDIITIIGNNYNEFVRNLEKQFPDKGQYIARLITSNQNRLYKTFPVYKKRGNTKKARTVYSPVGILKKLQKRLATFAESQFESHPNSHGFTNGKSTRTAAEQIKGTAHINEKEVTNLDIKGAFPAISGRALRSLLRHKTKTQLNAWQVYILSKIACNSEDRLATGAPSSPILFNWRLTAADFEIERAFKKRNWDFIRYADDISVIHYRTQKREAIELMIKILRKFDLRIERSKLKTFHKTLKKVVGLNVQYGEITIPRRIRRTIRAMTHQLKDVGLLSRNSYTVGQGFYNLKRFIKGTTRKRGTIEAQTAGFMAYVIHVHRLLIPTLEQRLDALKT
jgi:hypothetical protein